MKKFGWKWHCIFKEIGKHVNFWYIIDPKVFQSTSNALICMPVGLLCEINQY